MAHKNKKIKIEPPTEPPQLELLDLPDEVFLQIFKCVNWTQRNKLALVCQRFHSIIRDKELLPDEKVDMTRILKCKLKFRCGYFPITHVELDLNFLQNLGRLLNSTEQDLKDNLFIHVKTLSVCWLLNHIQFPLENTISYFPAVKHLIWRNPYYDKNSIFYGSSYPDLKKLSQVMNQIKTVTMNGCAVNIDEEIVIEFLSSCRNIKSLELDRADYLPAITQIESVKPITIKTDCIEITNPVNYAALVAKGHKLDVNTIQVNCKNTMVTKSLLSSLAQCLVGPITLKFENENEKHINRETIDVEFFFILLSKIRKVSFNLNEHIKYLALAGEMSLQRNKTWPRLETIFIRNELKYQRTKSSWWNIFINFLFLLPRVAPNLKHIILNDDINTDAFLENSELVKKFKKITITRYNILTGVKVSKQRCTPLPQALLHVKVLTIDYQQLQNINVLNKLLWLSKAIIKVEVLIMFNIKRVKPNFLSVIQNIRSIYPVNEVLLDKWMPEFECLNAEAYYLKPNSFFELYRVHQIVSTFTRGSAYNVGRLRNELRHAYP